MQTILVSRLTNAEPAAWSRAMAQILSAAEKLDWLQLARSGGVGPRTFFKLLERFGSARRAFEELPRLARETGAEEQWRRCPRAEAEAELEALERLGCELIAKGEAGYPSASPRSPTRRRC